MGYLHVNVQSYNALLQILCVFTWGAHSGSILNPRFEGTGMQIALTRLTELSLMKDRDTNCMQLNKKKSELLIFKYSLQFN